MGAVQIVPVIHILLAGGKSGISPPPGNNRTGIASGRSHADRRLSVRAKSGTIREAVTIGKSF
jgi:hypothetical protein